MSKLTHPSAAIERQDSDAAGVQVNDAATLSSAHMRTMATVERLRAVNRLLITLAPITDPAAVLPTACAQLGAILTGVGGLLVTVAHNTHQIAQRTLFGAPIDDQLTASLDELAQHALSSGSALTALHPRDRARGTERCALVAIPLRSDGGVIGALLVVAYDEGWPAEQWELLLSLAEAVAATLSRVQRQTEAPHDVAIAAAVTELASTALLVVDMQTRAIVYANSSAESLSGYSRDALCQRTSDQIITIITSAPDGEFEGAIQVHDGEPIPVIVATASFTAFNQELQLLTLHDLAAYRQQFFNKVKSESLAGLQRLTAAIAHEINNPLQAIANSLDLLLHRPLNDDKRIRYLSMAHHEVEQLSAIVRRMLDVHRSSNDGMRPIALQTMLESVIDIHAVQLEQAHIVLRREWDGQAAYVMGVAGDLRQVFDTLVRRALAAMPAGGELLVRTRPEASLRRGAPSMVLIEFADSGTEIEPTELGTIFEPFARTSGDTTGMGLPICYSIIAQHDGRLAANSGDEGSVFAIWLPAATVEDAPASAVDEQAPAGAQALEQQQQQQ